MDDLNYYSLCGRVVRDYVFDSKTRNIIRFSIVRHDHEGKPQFFNFFYYLNGRKIPSCLKKDTWVCVKGRLDTYEVIGKNGIVYYNLKSIFLADKVTRISPPKR